MVRKKEERIDELLKKNYESEKKVKSFIKRMEMIINNMELMGLDKAEFVLGSEVKEFGNSCHIPIPRKYLGKEVKIIVLKDKEDKKKS